MVGHNRLLDLVMGGRYSYPRNMACRIGYVGFRAVYHKAGDGQAAEWELRAHPGALRRVMPWWRLVSEPKCHRGVLVVMLRPQSSRSMENPGA